MPTTRTITVDPAVGACHISLSDRPVASTEEFSDDVLVDLDEFGVVIGIEVLDLDAGGGARRVVSPYTSLGDRAVWGGGGGRAGPPPHAELPLTDLCRQLHIHKDDEPHLARLLPTLRYSLRFTLASSPDPTIRARTATVDRSPSSQAA